MDKSILCRREHAKPASAIIASSMGVALLSINLPVGAQELEEIVVTAQRVEATAQETPISMDVLSSEELKDLGITSVSDLSQISSSLNISGEGGGIVLTVRGVSSRDVTEIGDPAVVVSTDGFYQDRAQALGLVQYDLERIELLRGPQGTLYGRNATGGAINIYTTAPQPEFGGYGIVEFGNYDALNAEGAVNIPLSDRVQMRASFGTQNHDHYRDDTSGFFDGIQNGNSQSGRLQFAFQPTDNIDVRITGQLTNQDIAANATYEQAYEVLPVETCNLAGGPGPCQRVDNSFIVNPPSFAGWELPAESLNRHDETLIRWDVEWRTRVTTITYLGGWNELDFESQLPGRNHSTPAGPNPVFDHRYFNQHERVQTRNQELRFASRDPSARFTYQAGIYSFGTFNDLYSRLVLPNGTPNPGVAINFDYDVELDSLSYLGQIGYRFNDNLKLSLGARQNQDEKEREGWIFFGPGGMHPPVPPTVDPGSDQTQSTYHIGLDWNLADESMMYAKFDTGYKAGGFTNIAPYGPEEIESFEIGTKNRFLDNRVELNIAAYISDYTGQQVQQITEEVGGLRIENAGETEYRGIETDLTVVSENGRFDLGVSLLDAEFTKFDLARQEPVWDVAGQAWVSLPAVNEDLSGKSPQQAPEVSVAAAYQHTFNLANGTLSIRPSAKYQSEQYLTFFNRPNDRQESYTTWNFLAIYEQLDSPWQFQIFGENLTDEIIFSQAGPNDRNHVYAYMYQPPRTYGIRFRYDW